MKRIFLLFLSVALCFNLLLLPCGAVADRPTYILDDSLSTFAADSFPTGLYRLYAYTSAVEYFYESPVLDFDQFEVSGNFTESMLVVDGPDDYSLELNAVYDSDSGELSFLLVLGSGSFSSFFDDLYAVKHFVLMPIEDSSDTPVLPDPPAPSPAVPEIRPEGVLMFFGDLSSWIISSLGSVNELLWSAGELTVVGFILISFLAVILILLLIYIIRKFLCFRG